MDATEIFEILARENTPMLLAYLRAGLTDSTVVDDLYQETMLIAWRRLEDFDKQKSFAAWIRGIAHHLLLQHYRAIQKASSTDMVADLNWIEDRFIKIDQLPGDSFQQKLALLRDCVQQLPDTYRDTIQLRYQQEKTLSEVSQLLNLSLETIKKRLVRAKVRLSQCIDHKLQIVEGH